MIGGGAREVFYCPSLGRVGYGERGVDIRLERVHHDGVGRAHLPSEYHAPWTGYRVTSERQRLRCAVTQTLVGLAAEDDKQRICRLQIHFHVGRAAASHVGHVADFACHGVPYLWLAPSGPELKPIVHIALRTVVDPVNLSISSGAVYVADAVHVRAAEVGHIEQRVDGMAGRAGVDDVVTLATPEVVGDAVKLSRVCLQPHSPCRTPPHDGCPLVCQPLHGL